MLPGRADRWKAAALVGAVALVLSALALAYPAPRPVNFSLALGLLVLSVPPLLSAIPAWLRAARGAAGGGAGRWLLGAALVAALVPERLVRGAPSDLVAPILYVAAVLLLTVDRPRAATALWRDPLLVMLVWLPLEFRWIPGDMVLLKLVGVNLLLLLYVIERPVFEMGRIVPLRSRELGWGVATYVGFLLVAVPVALATGFARPGVADRSPGYWVIWLVGVFWLTALPEEVLFRGAMQSLLSKVLPRPWHALALAALVFGLAHANNTPNAPDWRYVILAGIAGVAYGLAYLRTGNIAAAVLTHFLVDATWGGLFQGPT
jgi:membrane protease YdiL (CAAX protease family)